MSHTTSPQNRPEPSNGNDVNVDLNGYVWQKYSQGGEDGILFEILKRLGVIDAEREKWCVEFGAYDGVHLSNTCYLIREHGFRAVMIEAHKKRFRDLCRNLPDDNVVKLNRFVNLDGKDTLEGILGETELPKDFDLLSIDIDSCDYHIWDTLKDFRPKLVIIEFNPTVPVDVAYIQPRSFAVKHGSGVKAVDNLAREKGYTTVCVYGSNLIAVRDDLVGKISDTPPPPIEDMADLTQRRFVFVGYDGTVLSNFDELPVAWHPTTVDMEDMQFLPRFLRKHGDDLGPLGWTAFGLLDYWRRFKRLFRRKS